MAYDNIISRTDANAIIPIEVSREIIKGAIKRSAALQLFRQVNMGTKIKEMPVISALPLAYFVNGDTGLKQTTEVNWDKVSLIAEEIACIIPVPENVIDDVDYDMWGEIKPLCEEAVGIALDRAVFSSIGKPASFPEGIIPAAIAAGNVVDRGTSLAADGGIAGDINLLMAEVEEDGFEVNGFAARTTFKSRLRGARATDGQKLLDVGTNELEGSPIYYANNAFAAAGLGIAELVAGDFTQGIIGVRQDVTYKVLTEAVITNELGAIVYNLAQQDMVALRVKARFAFAVPNPINRENAVGSTRFPFAVLRSPAA